MIPQKPSAIRTTTSGDGSWRPRYWRRLTSLLGAIVLIAFVVVPAAAVPVAGDEGLLAETVTFNDGRITGYNGSPIYLIAGDGYPGGASVVGAGGSRAGSLEMQFERASANLLTSPRCRGLDGTGSLLVYDHSGPLEREVTLYDATIEFAPYLGIPNTFVLTGQWTDDTGQTGTFYGSGYYWTNPGPDHDEFGCVIQSWWGSPKVYGEINLVADGLVDIGPYGFGSEQCEAVGGSDASRVIDVTNQGLRTFVYIYQPTTEEVWICARVEDTSTGEGYGGRLKATPGDAGLGGGSGIPTTDSDSMACTTTTDPPNQVPGSHPISQGGVGSVDYVVDAYANDDEAWVCLQAGSSDHRVVVPLGGGSGTSFGTVATWYPDEGTPTP